MFTFLMDIILGILAIETTIDGGTKEHRTEIKRWKNSSRFGKFILALCILMWLGLAIAFITLLL